MTEKANAEHVELAEVLREEYRALRPDRTLETDTGGDRRANAAAIQEAMLREQRENGRPLTALCVSGGGIRSATFALGALQRLAQLKLLTQFDYLSSVSGGGYISSWLKAWAARSGGMAGVQDELAKTAVEPGPVRHLRYFSNYLAPRLGLFSADAWTLVSTYLRNLIVNWLLLIPLLLVPLLVPRFMAALLGPAISLQGGWILLGIGVAFLVGGLVYTRWQLPSSGFRALGQGPFILFCLLPLGISVLIFTIWWSWILAHPEYRDAFNFWSWWPWLVGQIGPQAPFGFISFLGLALAFYLFAFGVEKLRPVLVGARTPEEARRGGEQAHWLAELAATLVTAVVAASLVWTWTRLFPEEKTVSPELFVCLAASLLWGAFVLAETLYIGIASYLTSDEDREWWARSGAWILIASLGWIALGTAVVYGPWIIESWRTLYQGGLAVAGLGAGAVTARVGFSAATPATAQMAKKLAARAWRPAARGLLLALAAPTFVVVFLVFLSWGTDWLLRGLVAWLREAPRVYALVPFLPPDPAWLETFAAEGQPGLHFAILRATPWPLLGTLAVLLGLVTLAMSRSIDINRFSLHSMYRNRLIRAYLGASRGKERCENPFTGFDPADNLPLKCLAPGEGGTVRVDRPLHVVNIALNLVFGQDLAAQERKAASFTMSALHCGGYDVGYRRTSRYGGMKGPTLGTAMAISGAAVSPNMGYHSSPPLAFIMSLFNVRLGWWLGNPRFETAREPGPRWAGVPLLRETLGLTDDNSPWIYLSDGGHFENLGVYEMVVRRCRYIVLLDASADPKFEFEDLANAIRKVRADLGIPIELEGELQIGPSVQPPKAGRRCALFRIRYSGRHGTTEDPDDGKLLYLKPAVYGREPMDVLSYYQRSSSKFPHETTLDQFFGESQFESYRALGFYSVSEIVNDHGAVDIPALFAAAKKHLKS